MHVRCDQCGAEKDAPPEVIEEILRRHPDFFEPYGDRADVRLVCKACGGRYQIVWLGLDWEDARTCEQCGRPIPRERLDAEPQATRCVACQTEAERRPPVRVLDRVLGQCPRCGGRLKWKVRRRVEPADYFIGCDNWPRCWYSE